MQTSLYAMKARFMQSIECVAKHSFREAA
jgi:hypothetical protein